MNKKLIAIGITLVFLVVGLSGCATTQVPTSSKSAVNINIFASVTEGELIRFYFTLEDIDGINTISDGSLTMNIYDDEDAVLYTQQLKVKASEFKDYGYVITGTPIGKAYEWRVPVEDIKKGSSFIGFGKAILTFVTSEGKTLNAEDNLVQIPTYTDEELEDMAEDDYHNFSKNIDKKITKGSFSVKVTKVGYFNQYLYGISTEYFRVDMIIENVGSESEYFMPDGVVIIDNKNNQYPSSYLGTLDLFSTVYPQSKIEGYLLFEDIPKSVTINKLVFELGWDENFNPYLFQFNLNL